MLPQSLSQSHPWGQPVPVWRRPWRGLPFQRFENPHKFSVTFRPLPSLPDVLAAPTVGDWCQPKRLRQFAVAAERIVGSTLGRVVLPTIPFLCLKPLLRGGPLRPLISAAGTDFPSPSRFSLASFTRAGVAPDPRKCRPEAAFHDLHSRAQPRGKYLQEALDVYGISRILTNGSGLSHKARANQGIHSRVSGGSSA